MTLCKEWFDVRVLRNKKDRWAVFRQKALEPGPPETGVVFTEKIRGCRRQLLKAKESRPPSHHVFRKQRTKVSPQVLKNI